jgi:hypothetical protein
MVAKGFQAHLVTRVNLNFELQGASSLFKKKLAIISLLARANNAERLVSQLTKMHKMDPPHSCGTGLQTAR